MSIITEPVPDSIENEELRDYLQRVIDAYNEELDDLNARVEALENP